MSSNEEHEELTADDLAWANMSYSERLVWWVNNKVLAKPDQTTSAVETTQSQDTQEDKVIDVEDTKEEVKQEETKEAEVQQEEVQYEEPKQEAMESPAKKRSGKGKKISITLDA